MSAVFAGATAAGGSARLPRHWYVHVPFCASRCAYCDFYSSTDRSAAAVERTFASIRDGLDAWAELRLPGEVETIYFGGGTPTVVAAEVAAALEYLKQKLPLASETEITVEANPDSLDDATLETLLAVGVDRISIGVQSFDEGVLATLGRRHDARSARSALQRAVGSGARVSADLICGVPGQSMTSWLADLDEIGSSGVGHISVYPLSIESGTVLSRLLDAGALSEPDPDEAADMMIAAERVLGAHGIERYEVANYAATPSLRSRHNLAYWTGRSYAALGPGAHGMLDLPTGVAAGLVRRSTDASRIRYANMERGPDPSASSLPDVELLTAEEASREDVMLGLRLVEGVVQDLVGVAGLEATMQELARDGLVERAEDRWRTTERGWLLGNEVFSRVWQPSGAENV